MESFRQFVEMPLANYRVAPFTRPNFLNPPNIFIPRDRKAIQTLAVQNKLAERLSKSTGYNFNIIFLETKFSTKSNYIDEVHEYCIKNNIPLKNHITFAKNSSSGDVLSPWMILHTIGHALLDSADLTSIGKILNQIKVDYPNVTKGIFQFKSARDGKTFINDANPEDLHHKLDQDELIYDMVADYLWHGKIRYANINDSYIKQIESIINSQLVMYNGSIIVDFFND